MMSSDSTNSLGVAVSNSQLINTSISGGDILQQAMHLVVDDENEQNCFPQQSQQDDNLFTFVPSDVNVSDMPMVQLTQEQAASLGINFNELGNNMRIEPATGETNAGYQEGACVGVQEQEQQLIETEMSQEEAEKILNELTQSGSLRKEVEETLIRNWTVQPEEELQQQQNSMEANTVIKPNMENNSNHQINQIEEQTSNFFHIQANQSEKLVQEQNIPKNTSLECNKNVSSNTIQFSVASNPQVNNMSQSHTQIIPRIPMILPSSHQLIIKPRQTVLTPVKNIRILSNITKVNTAQSPQNSLLLPKSTLINTASSQYFKAVPFGTQFLSTANNLSTQLLNTAQLTSKINNQCSNSSSIISSQIITTNASTVPNVMQHTARQTSVQRPVQIQIQQKANPQQFFNPIPQSVVNGKAVKSSSLNGSTLKKTHVTPVLQTINPSLLKTNLIKAPVTITLPASKNANQTMVFKTSPVIKTDPYLKQSTSLHKTSIIRGQILGTPVSILKPQIKAVNNNLVKKHLTNITHKNPLTKTLKLDNGLKSLVTAKIKQNVNSLMKSIKKQPVPHKPIIVRESLGTDAKLLKSSDNPLQTISQSDNHQNFTQAHLEQIVQALNEQDSNENIYRIVVNDDVGIKMKNSNSLLKNRNSKRGRPKKGAVKAPTLLSKPVGEEDQDDSRDVRKKIARTRSGRLSRPPRHMVRDYKHLHTVDFAQPDTQLDDSDGGYSDYNTNSSIGNGSKLGQEDDEVGQKIELLAGLEMPKRKISDDFKCPACSKIYLGRNRMAKHFLDNPDHGSLDQLPPISVETELKSIQQLDPLKPKGKKRGPWAYTTPEAKSERRQLKLQEAISVCQNSEIVKVAAKPVVSSLSLYELLLLKSESNVTTFLSEIKEFTKRVREKASTMLSAVNINDKSNHDEVVDLREQSLCDVLALNLGSYKVKEPLIAAEEVETEEKSEFNINFELKSSTEPPIKQPKMENITHVGKGDVKENGYFENSNLSVSKFFKENKNGSLPKSDCPELPTALTLSARNKPSTSSENDILNKITPTSKFLDSSMEIHNTDTPRFQKLSINPETKADPNFIKEGTFTKLGDSLGEHSCSNDVFSQFNGNLDQSKVENMQRTFIKLEPTEKGFIKLENGIIGGFPQEIGDFGKIQSNGFHYASDSIIDNFNSKGFQKLVPKTMSANTSLNFKQDNFEIPDNNSNHALSENSIQITTSSNSNGSMSDAANIFETNVNIDITRMTTYEPMDIMNENNVIDKNLLLHDHLQLDDNTSIDEFVSERFNSIIPDTISDSNFLQNNGNMGADLNFAEFSEEFNKNSRS